MSALGSKPRRKHAPTGPKRRPTPGTSPTPSLLVLHLNTEKLRADGLSFEPLLVPLGYLAPPDRLRIVATTTRQELDSRLSELRGTPFDAVVVFAHSNAQEIRVASDADSLSWSEFAKLLKPFCPRRLVLIACKAGRFDGVQHLFRRLPKLRYIYASPTNVRAMQAAAMLALGTTPSRPPQELLTALQVGTAVVDGGQIREWRRERCADADRELLDLVADLVDEPLRRLAKSWPW